MGLGLGPLNFKKYFLNFGEFLLNRHKKIFLNLILKSSVRSNIDWGKSNCLLLPYGSYSPADLNRIRPHKVVRLSLLKLSFVEHDLF